MNKCYLFSVHKIWKQKLDKILAKNIIKQFLRLKAFRIKQISLNLISKFLDWKYY